MATPIRKTIEIAATSPTTKFLVAVVGISSPASNAKLGATVTVTGTASCTLCRNPLEPIELGDASASITAVDVRVGGASTFQRATPKGPSTKPWSSWSFNGTATSTGSLTITARVSAAQTGAESDTAEHTRTVIIDLTPPTLTINPPANVTKPAPPYTATITGKATDNASGSGVAAVEWRLGSSGAFQLASGTSNWSASVPLPPTLGSHTVSVRARDVLGNVSPTQTVTVKAVDITGPTLSITTPPDGETFPLSGGVVTVEVKGTASDSQTGVSIVEWDLDGQNQFKPVTPKAANDWSTWSVAIPITTASTHTISLRAKDKATPANNVSKQDRSTVVSCPPSRKTPRRCSVLGGTLMSS